MYDYILIAAEAIVLVPLLTYLYASRPLPIDWQAMADDEGYEHDMLLDEYNEIH